MKTILYTLTSLLSLLPIFSSLSQTTPICSESIQLTNPNVNMNTFEVTPLRPSRQGAVFYHLWWSGDNSFSFAAKPNHNHRNTDGNSKFPFDVKMTDITTEGYGTGGPPPLAYTFDYDMAKPSSTHRTILQSGENLHVQNYRNAVAGDMLYLIITYGNISDIWTGKIVIDAGDYAVVSDSMLNVNKHFLSNGETWNSSTGVLTLPQNILPNAEHSVLIPLMISESSLEELNMKVDLYQGGNLRDEFTIAPTVAYSHDPNIMIEHSNAKNQCDYRGGNIHYTVKFQNEGTGPTKYVRVECLFDDKVDLRTIDNIEFPSYYGLNNITKGPIHGSWDNSSRAVWHIDTLNRKLILEMHNMCLETITDPNLPNLDLARDQIEFDIKVSNNYLFGPPVLAYSKIYFDGHAAIVTNIAETGCTAPVSLDNGGGFQCEQSFFCKYIWYLLGLLLLIILLLILFLRRKKRNKVELGKV